MNDTASKAPPFPAPAAITRKKPSFSIVWLVPLAALIIGGWLVVKALSEKGPVITISFKTAEGLEAGKTKIKYKDVDVGVVEDIRLSEDLAEVRLTASLVRGMETYLNDQTRFWVVRARLTAGEVSGLSTLFAGVYIAIDPGRRGAPKKIFEGLERAPVVTTDFPGRHFILKAERLGSLDIGSPVYYRQIRVGQVTDYHLDENGQYVTLTIFINDPHHQMVFKNSRFWNASGIDMKMDAGGLKVNTQSLVSLMIGGISFETPFSFEPAESAAENDVFILYADQEAANQKKYQTKRYWLLRFDGSVRGLSVGAPVEFRGIRIGEVVDIGSRLDLNIPETEFSIPVLIMTEQERYFISDEIKSEDDMRRFLDRLVKKGLRAQLKTGNLITGQLFVDMDFHPAGKDRAIDWSGPYPVFPTVQQPLEEAAKTLFGLIERLEKIPFEELGKNIGSLVNNLNASILLTRDLMQQINAGVVPELSTTLSQAQKTLAAMEKMVAQDSPLSQEASQALSEVSEAARAMRFLMDYLERHPDALIYGKGNEK